MDLRVLRYFMGIVDAGGFGKASNRLYISQPALSKAIRGLEEELEVRLLERGKRGGQIRLTPAGEVVYRHAASLLEGKQRMEQELQMLSGLETGFLKIGMSPMGSGVLLGPIIARFHSLYPKVKIELFEQGGAAQEEALRNNEVELATSLVPDDDNFNWLMMRDEPMMVALPINHPLSERPSLTLSDLADTELVTYRESFVLKKMIYNACIREGFEPRNEVQITQAEFGMALVASGTGAMLLPRLVAEQIVSPGVALKPLLSSTLRWRPALIWRKDATLSFAATAMIELVREHYSKPAQPRP